MLIVLSLALSIKLSFLEAHGRTLALQEQPQISPRMEVRAELGFLEVNEKVQQEFETL